MKDCNVGAETMCFGRELQSLAMATRKARLPTEVSLTGDNQPIGSGSLDNVWLMYWNHAIRIAVAKTW